MQDGLIHKDEFVYALFKVQSAGNLFTDRVFKMFDTKENDVIDFGEFVHALSVFHPKAALKDKAACALPYQQNGTGTCRQVCDLAWQRSQVNNIPGPVARPLKVKVISILLAGMLVHQHFVRIQGPLIAADGLVWFQLRSGCMI